MKSKMRKNNIYILFICFILLSCGGEEQNYQGFIYIKDFKPKAIINSTTKLYEKLTYKSSIVSYVLYQGDEINKISSCIKAIGFSSYYNSKSATAQQ